MCYYSYHVAVTVMVENDVGIIAMTKSGMIKPDFDSIVMEQMWMIAMVELMWVKTL